MPRANAEHLYLEASRLAFADRNAYLADPEYVDAPVDGLLSKEFAAQRRSLIRADKAAGVVPAGDPILYENDQSFPLRPQQKRDPGRRPHHPPDGVGQGRQCRRLHLHDRILGRQRHRGAGLRLPAE
jgi:hypothetical protein